MAVLSVRPPTHVADGSSFTPPPLPFLLGKWHIIFSTLPMWRSYRNVTITYSAIPAPESAAGRRPSIVNKALANILKTKAPPPGKEDEPRIDDLVEYQSLKGEKLKTIRGIDTLGEKDGTYKWRGAGLLKLLTSHWEILGWRDGNGVARDADGPKESLIITYFAKTHVTPAGIDVYACSAEGLSQETIAEVKSALKACAGEELGALGDELFEITRDEKTTF